MTRHPALEPARVQPASDPALVEVTGGVDTHKDTHTAAALDSAGRVLGSASFPSTLSGYAALLGWLRSFGTLLLVGIEGTGVYGAGLAGHLLTAGVATVEIDRPDRKARRWQGKSDPPRRRGRRPRRAGRAPHRHPEAARRPGRSAASAAGGPAQRGVPARRRPAPEAQSPDQRGLQLDLWGTGTAAGAGGIVERLAPTPADWRLTKWRYSAFCTPS